ncbi:TolB family protein [Modestobacter altitudinis]|uniref:TolB family protein n=1 Tax=Modestobacter altitudinis TaxID=2213158 RepID=UPI0014863E12|nr:PD40 domain-containing protein [Modestobacter altitudinis]
MTISSWSGQHSRERGQSASRAVGVGRFRRAPAVATLAVSMVVALPTSAAAAPAVTILVSRADGANGLVGDEDSFLPSTNADGHLVAFQSNANNLSADDNDNVDNIFVRDVRNGRTRLVSRADGANGAAADNASTFPSISGENRVAFQSRATNLSAVDLDAVEDVFARDVGDGTTVLVSRTNGISGAAGDGDSGFASISQSGRFVAFQSDADNLSANDNNAVTNVFVRDLQNGSTRLVDRANGTNGAAADAGAAFPSVSADGRYVAFESAADNLSANDDDAVTNVFVRDVQNGTTRLVSRADGSNGDGADDGSSNPSISGNGRYVAFESNADNLSGNDNDNVSNVFVRDLQNGTTRLISRASGTNGAGADDASLSASISGNGRYVAFESLADNLSADDDNNVFNVFVRDLDQRATTLVSRASGTNGPGGNDSSNFPAMSADGGSVAFQSAADNLSAEDDDNVLNIFVRLR